MSFTFKWPRFSDQFHANAIQMLDAALNKGNKPPVIADKIEVVELEMGTQVRGRANRIPRRRMLRTHAQPPELEVRDIGELTMDQFRGIFRLTYEGDAHIVLRTKVQVRCAVFFQRTTNFERTTLGEPAEPQAARHTYARGLAGNARSEATSGGAHASTSLALQARLVRRACRLAPERDHARIQDGPAAERRHQQHLRLDCRHTEVHPA